MSLLQIEVLQQVYDHVTERLLYYTEVPKEMFSGIDPVTLNYPAHYECAEKGKAALSPAHLVAIRFGDIYMDELVDISTTTPRDIINELQTGGLTRLPFLEAADRFGYTSNVEKTETVAELVSMIIDFETVFSSDQPIEKWAEKFVQIAKLHFLRWDLPFIVRKLLPEVPVEEPVVESRTASLINSIESQGYKPVVEVAADLPKNDLHLIYSGIATDMNKATEVLNNLVNKRNEAKAKSQDPFFSRLGDKFTFVTEHTNPTLKFGQLVKKEVVYSIDNPEGDVFFVFEVIDERGYTESERVTSLERAIVCKGDQIHYTDFNKVVKTMLRRLDL